LVAAIKGWPKRIERISIEVYTDDFGCDKRNRDKFKIGKKGSVTLTPGWLPTERDMEGFAAKVKKDRSNLKEVHLVIRARTTAFTSQGVLSKGLLAFKYIKHNPTIMLTEKTPNTIGTRDTPIDVEDFDSTCAKAQSSETTTSVDQSVIDVLHNAMLEYEEMMADRSDAEDDSFDETDAEIEAMQERADELDDGEDLEEEEGDDGWRPRWVAI
jgi:hypothetical protein